MKFYELGDLELQPGRLTVWRLDVPDPVCWRHDLRRPSYVQEEHFGYLADGQPTWLGVSFERPGKLDPVAFTRAMLDWVNRHEGLRSRFIKNGSAIQRATTCPDNAVLLRTELTEYTNADELARTMEELFDTATNPLHWPAYVFVTVSRPCSTSVVLAFDHSITDAYSLASAPHEIDELYTAAIDGVMPKLAPICSPLDYAEVERARLTNLDSSHPAICHWRELIVANSGRFPDFPVQIGASNGAVQCSGRIQLLDAANAEEFERACWSEGGNTAVGVFACLALASKAIGNQPEFRTVGLFHTRGDTRWKGSFGWYVGTSPVRFAVPDRFSELLRSAKLELERAKETAQVPFSKVTELLGATLRPPFVASYMDIRKMPASRRWGRWQTRFLISRCADPRETYLWINRSHKGIYVSFRHPGTATARSAVDRYLNKVSSLANSISGDMPGSARSRLL
ncbi:hypothetical protein QO004_006092 [Rhizobium mesoamericanum]|uniref:condensation domain-containing protein n=1 Tax=Rhizobium mesoamericanum TaxID=1079800 RepID=UPI00278ABFD3|nr:condensation domain-containing protein [Rhizobium mesoamericanum]MDQ0564274.1 hypothetical protein [Rhizobium mesoamericanum]